MILKYPYPYQAWLTVANDPDNTLIDDWRELDEFIWKTLKLPISNSLFVKSYNQNLPDQVNLADRPEILSQKHDIIHTWGDYMHSRGKGFDRQDAIDACVLLKAHKVFPKVWIDHAQFSGNLIHNMVLGSIPEFKDQSGIVYENYEYTLDLVKELGISYVWNGEISDTVGQDYVHAPFRFFKNNSKSKLKTFVKTVSYYVAPFSLLRRKFKLNLPDNQQYSLHEFPDGNKFYTFVRYGNWLDADIYGLGNIISPDKIDELLVNGGTMIAYTHLGKRPLSKFNEPFHIPKKTKLALQHIKTKFDQKTLMVSPISDLLDYLILRDHTEYNQEENSIEIVPDGVRYQNIGQVDVSGKKISFKGLEIDLHTLKVKSGHINLDFEVILEDDKAIFSIYFK